jgi:hypothetical protein
MASLALVPTLYDLEESLTALLDTQDMVAPEDEQAFLADFEAALSTATDKRDRVAGRLAKLEAQQAYAAAEIKRLQAFKRSAEAQQSRLENYVAYVIQRLGKDAKGKWRKLEGNSSTLSLKACPASVEVTDEPAIPIDFKRATVTLPAAMLNDILGVLADCTPKFFEEVAPEVASSLKLEVDKRAVKATIDAGEVVPGAKLITDKTTLGRK